MERPPVLDFDSDYYKTILDNLYEGVYFVDCDRRITYWNKGAEHLTGFRKEDVVGLRCADNILTHMSLDGVGICQSGCPLAGTITDGQSHEIEVYLHHRDGHRVPVVVRSTPIKDREGRIIGAVEVFRDALHMEYQRKRIEQLEQMALLDSLTRLANRQHTEANLQIRLEEFSRYGWSFGILFIDIDHFKRINDSFGHLTGDKVLKLVSMTLLNSLRPFDFLGRWGGEEFVAVVVNVNAEQLSQIAERSRRLVAASTLQVGQGTIEVTVSIGATMARVLDKLEDLVSRADALMYQGKQAGRNQVRLG
jgi:diguanylate cyclase (GGDEF)-like protein/PAS domain S-box-containing protein